MAHREITLALKDYVGPDCPCGLEDRIRALPGVHDIQINPVADTVHLAYDSDVLDLEQLKHTLAQMGCPCAGEPEHPAQAHLEHEHHKAEGHDHHAMMEADFRRRFWVVLVLTIPILLLSPTIQEWLGFRLTFPGARLSRATMRKMRQNLVWATGYNTVAIPAAAGVFYPVGLVLRPEWGALIMAASTLIVAANALLLRRTALGRA